MSSLKKDAGKVRMELLPPLALKRIAQVFTFGAKKYTKIEDLNTLTLFKLCQENGLNVTQIKKCLEGECVEIVTKSGLRKLIPSTQKTKESLQKSEENEIENVFVSKRELETNAPKERQDTKNCNGKKDSLSLGLQKPLIRSFVTEDAVYAERLNIFTLIMTIQQESSEEFFVVSATTELECLETMFGVLKERSIISKELLIRNNKITTEGSWAWSKGIEYSRIYAAMHRHLNAWYSGETHDFDPNCAGCIAPVLSSASEPCNVHTGQSHLHNAGACIMMLIEMEELRPDLDDRPKHYGEGTTKEEV